MMTLRVFCIVEGHGDVESFPILVRRIANEILAYYDISVEQSYRLPKGKITKIDDLGPALELASRRLRERSGPGDCNLILVTRDADNDCVVEVAQTLKELCAETIAGPIARIAIADEEFEAWLLAGAEGLRTHRDCRGDFDLPGNVDDLKSPKAIFEGLILKAGRSYSETVDQPKFAASMALDELARARSRSLRHLVSTIQRAITC